MSESDVYGSEILKFKLTDGKSGPAGSSLRSDFKETNVSSPLIRKDSEPL